MEAKTDNTVIFATFVDGKAEQLWKKGTPDGEGFFSLKNSEVPKVITAISESGLEIKGNTMNSYRVFKLDMHESKHLLGHQKCTFKS